MSQNKEMYHLYILIAAVCNSIFDILAKSVFVITFLNFCPLVLRRIYVAEFATGNICLFFLCDLHYQNLKKNASAKKLSKPISKLFVQLRSKSTIEISFYCSLCLPSSHTRCLCLADSVPTSHLSPKTTVFLCKIWMRWITKRNCSKTMQLV